MTPSTTAKPRLRWIAIAALVGLLAWASQRPAPPTSAPETEAGARGVAVGAPAPPPRSTRRPPAAAESRTAAADERDGAAAIAGRDTDFAPRPRTTRVRVRLVLTEAARAIGVPEPELLWIDEHGSAWPVDAELASPAADAQRSEPVRRFEIVEPGRYVAAWHLWRQVPGTRTRRAVRGRGPEIVVAGDARERTVSVTLDAADLALDASLDRHPSGATYRFTAKDG